MTNAQKTAIKISEKDKRVSEIRARLNEIEGLETVSDEVRTEQTALVNDGPGVRAYWPSSSLDSEKGCYMKPLRSPRSDERGSGHSHPSEIPKVV